MNKCVFILPYFGQFPEYFNIFLRSCATNTKYDWVIFTDDKTEYKYPSNVRVIYLTFDELRVKFEEKLSSDISLPKPYKLCDFKPTYGYVLSEYVEGYEYWGHCDCDLIFGDLNRILTPLLEEGYDKLFAAGHLTIYKNNYENNTRFMSDYHGRSLYKEFLTVPEICWFDEDWKTDNIHTLFLQKNKKVYCDSLACNPSGKYARFVQRNYIPSEHRYVEEKYKKALYLWTNGRVIRQFEEGNALVTEEFLYMHFQHRNMELKDSALTCNYVQIIPNKFISLDKVPNNLEEWKAIKKETISSYLHTFDQQKKRIARKIKKIAGRE